MQMPNRSAETPTPGHPRALDHRSRSSTRIPARPDRSGPARRPARPRPTLVAWGAGLAIALVGLGVGGCDSTSPLGPERSRGDLSVSSDGSGWSSGGRDGDSADGLTDGGRDVLRPHEPAGFRKVTETSFSSVGEGGFSGTSFGEGSFSIVSDPTAPYSGPSVARAYYPAGLGDGVSPVSSEVSIGRAGVEELYVSYWLKISDDWDGHRTGVNKTTILWTHQKPVVVVKIQGSGSNRLGSSIGIQDVPDGNRRILPNVSDLEIERGRWHHWEVLLRSNRGNAADGEVHWWVDGRKVGEYRDLRFGTADQSKIWDTAAWRPVWGGRGDVLSKPQEMWMDHFYLSGRSW